MLISNNLILLSVFADPVGDAIATAESAQLPMADIERSTPLHPGVDRPLQTGTKLFYFRFIQITIFLLETIHLQRLADK